MKFKILFVGNTDDQIFREAISDYLSRLSHYIPVETRVIPDLKNRSKISRELQREREGELILGQLGQGDYLVLLDERGSSFSSVELSKWVEKVMASGRRQVTFVIGGPYGFSKSVYERSDFKLSLSRLTFSHQMVRLIFLEQLYRAMTILNNEPYHHE